MTDEDYLRLIRQERRNLAEFREIVAPEFDLDNILVNLRPCPRRKKAVPGGYLLTCACFLGKDRKFSFDDVTEAYKVVQEVFVDLSGLETPELLARAKRYIPGTKNLSDVVLMGLAIRMLPGVVVEDGAFSTSLRLKATHGDDLLMDYSPEGLAAIGSQWSSLQQHLMMMYTEGFEVGQGRNEAALASLTASMAVLSMAASLIEQSMRLNFAVTEVVLERVMETIERQLSRSQLQIRKSTKTESSSLQWMPMKTQSYCEALILSRCHKIGNDELVHQFGDSRNPESERLKLLKGTLRTNLSNLMTDLRSCNLALDAISKTWFSQSTTILQAPTPEEFKRFHAAVIGNQNR